MLSVRQDGKLFGQDKADIAKGEFTFGVFSNNGSGYKPGTYQGEISLSVPGVQPKEFVELAGIEYENLCGVYVDRTGTGPTINYEFEFKIK